MTISVQTNSPVLTALENLNQLNGQVGAAGNATSDSAAAPADTSLTSQDAAIWDVGPSASNSVQAGLTTNLNKAASIADSAVSGSVSVLDLLDQLRQNARSAADPSLDASSRSDLNGGYKSLLSQIGAAVSQSSFGGVNLLDGSVSSALQLPTDASGASTVTLSATNLSLGGPVVSLSSTSSIGTTAAASSAVSQLDASITGVQRALAQISVQNQAIQSHLGIVARASDTNAVSGQVTSAIDQDGARLLSLQIQQQLASSQLPVANQSSQAILSLFR